MQERLRRAWPCIYDLAKAILMPGALIFIALSVDGAVKQAQLRADNLGLAVSVLSEPETTEPLRKLAVDLLAASLPDGIELSDDLRQSLESGSTVLPRVLSATASGGMTISGSVIGEVVRTNPEEPQN